MLQQLNNILLIDDNKIDNFFHERVIRKYDPEITVTSYLSAVKALEYLGTVSPDQLPDLIFLDINMPVMSGWEFLEEYGKFNFEHGKTLVIIMLSTSENSDDKVKALSGIAADYKSKPLTLPMLSEIHKSFAILKKIAF